MAAASVSQTPDSFLRRGDGGSRCLYFYHMAFGAFSAQAGSHGIDQLGRCRTFIFRCMAVDLFAFLHSDAPTFYRRVGRHYMLVGPVVRFRIVFGSFVSAGQSGLNGDVL